MAEGDYKVKAIVSADTTQFNDGMKKAQSSLSNISKSIQGVQNLLKSAFSVVGITASVGAVANFGKKAVAAADEANKRFNILANTIKATGANTWTSVEELDKMAKAYAQSTNYSVSEVEKMQSVLLGFRNITGETFEQASDAIMDMATVMGMDLTSAVQTVGKALDDPVKGLDSLRRQGFQFTEEQKAELQQLIKNGDQLKAQQIILNELATTYGGAAKAGQSAFAKLQHTMDEFKENIGNKLMPVVETVMSKVTENMNKITSIINSSDFDNFVAIIINVGNKVKSALDKIFKEVKTTFDNIKASFGSVDFGPFMKIMDTLVALVQKTFSEIKQRIQDSFATFAELKERMGVFTDALDLDKIVNIINTVVDVFSYLYDSIREIQEEIRKVIFDNIVNIWNYIKQIFNNSNKALEENEKGFASWGEFIWDQVNNVFRIFQDLFGMISQLIKGNWAAAWEYAKLAFMRMADVVLNLLSQIANAFPKLINKIIDGLNGLIQQINKIRSWLKLDEWDLVKPFESVDLSESSGLNAKIAEAEKKIAELTGKQADYAIDEIKKVSKAAAGFTQSVIEDITDTTDVIISDSNKRTAVEVSGFQTTESEADNTYKKISDWDLKLLNQKLDGLKEYSKKYHDTTLEIIEAERQKALEADTTGADTEKINKYYNKQIELENKRFSKLRLAQALNVTGEILKTVVNLAKQVVSVISGIFNAVKNTMLKLFDFNIDDALDNLLVFEDKILTFFVETLPKLPGFVASVLQSISVLIQNVMNSGGLANLGNILASIISSLIKEVPLIVKSIMPVIKSIMDSIFSALENGDVFDSILDIIMDGLDWIFKKLTSNIPKIIKLLTNVVTKIIKKLPELLKIILPALSTLISELIKALPEFINTALPTLLDGIKILVMELIKALPEIMDALVQALPQIIVGVINAVTDFIKNLTVDDLANIIKSIIIAIGTLVKGLIQAIPQILKALLDLLVEVVKHMGEIFVEALKKAWSGAKWLLDQLVGFVKKIFGFEHGTNNAPKGLAIVGEKGPELVDFKGGERVYNNTNTKKMFANANGGGNVFNVTFNNLQDTSAYAMMSQLRAYNRQMAINGVI